MVAPRGTVLILSAPVPVLPVTVAVGVSVAVGTAVGIFVVTDVVGMVVGNIVGIPFMKIISGTRLCSPGLTVTVVVYSLYPG